MPPEDARCFKMGALHPRFTDAGRDYLSVVEKLRHADCDVYCVQGLTSRFNAYLRGMEGFETQSLNGLGLVLRCGEFTVYEKRAVLLNLLERVAARVERGLCPDVRLPDSIVNCRITLSVPACVWCVKHSATGVLMTIVNFDVSAPEAQDASLQRALMRELCSALWDPTVGICVSWDCAKVIIVGHFATAVSADECRETLTSSALPVVRPCQLACLAWSITPVNPARNHYRAFYRVPSSDALGDKLLGVSAIRGHFQASDPWHGHQVEIIRLETADAHDGTFQQEALSNTAEDGAKDAKGGSYIMPHGSGGCPIGHIVRVEALATRSEDASDEPVTCNGVSPAVFEVDAHFVCARVPEHKPTVVCASEQSKGSWIAFTPDGLSADASRSASGDGSAAPSTDELQWAYMRLL